MRGLHYEWSLAAPMTTQLRGRCSGYGSGSWGDGVRGGEREGPTAVVCVVVGKECVVVVVIIVVVMVIVLVVIVVIMKVPHQ